MDLLPNVRWQKQKCLHFWFWHYRWDIQFKSDWRISGRKWNNFAVHSADKHWYVLGIITYYAFCISQTIMGMNCQDGWQTMENMRLIWNSKELFKILQPFWTFGNRWSHCEIQGKGSFQTEHPEKTQMFRYQNVQTMRLYRIYIWHECLHW